LPATICTRLDSRLMPLDGLGDVARNGRGRCRSPPRRRRRRSAPSSARSRSPTVEAAATAGGPARPWQAFGWRPDFSMSLTVIRPTRGSRRRPRSAARSCAGAAAAASSWLTPSRTVTRFSLVISSEAGWRGSVAKRMSRLVRMPTSLPDRPCADHREAGDLAPRALDLADLAERRVGADGQRVDHHAALVALHLAHLVGLLLDERLRCRTPMPPAWAMAMASRLSVTVSMAADTIGMFRLISRVRNPAAARDRGRRNKRQPRRVRSSMRRSRMVSGIAPSFRISWKA
jgi:hypothetical protein